MPQYYLVLVRRWPFFFFFFFFAFHFFWKKFVPPHFSAPSYATGGSSVPRFGGLQVQSVRGFIRMQSGRRVFTLSLFSLLWDYIAIVVALILFTSQVLVVLTTLPSVYYPVIIALVENLFFYKNLIFPQIRINFANYKFWYWPIGSLKNIAWKLKYCKAFCTNQGRLQISD